jgi:hypothetical protein
MVSRQLQALTIDNLHLEGQTEATGHANDNVDPPHRPANVRTSTSPRGDTNQSEHVDNCGKSHRKGPEEERLHRVPYHEAPCSRIESISQDRNGQEKGKQKHVRYKENDTKDSKGAVVTRIYL